MRLKSIKLAGFKSFVDPTTVNFPSNLSAVVGPNGCGKSNIIDAVRWVMGESSAKNLRGEAMTDVIFNGSNTRKPIGQASIELIFDNSAGKLAGEYGRFSEISVKRKVTRDGDNIYYLNGNKCRRRDITDLFLGTGLGPRSYAIIEQGMISRLIEARPEDLRVYVEEAAGISKYKERRRDTENRIRHTRENLERLQDIRDELERQLSRLERQAAAARKFRELKTEEREVRARLAAAELSLLLDQQRTQNRAITELELKVEAEVTARVARNTQIEQERLASEAEVEAFNRVQARFYEAGADINRLQQSLNFGRERQQQVARDLDQCERDLAEARAHERADAQRCEALEVELAALVPELELARETEAECELEVEARDADLHQWQSAWDTFNANAAGPRQRAEVEQSRIQYLEQVLQRSHERLKRATAEQAAAGLQQADAEALAELELSVAALDEERADLLEAIEIAGSALEQARATARDATAQLDSRRRAANQLQGRIASLEALQQAALGGGDKTRNAWLERVGLAQLPRLAEVLQVPDGWQRAAEAVLGSALQARLVSSLETYAEALGGLPSGELILIEAGADAADGLVAQWHAAAGALLAGTAPAENLTDALARRHQLAPGASLVTPDGVQVGRHWLKSARRAAGDTGVLARARELEECAAELSRAESAIAQLEEVLQEARAAEGAAEARLAASRARQTEVARELAAKQASLAQQTAKLQRARELSERATRDAAELREQIRLETEQLAEARGALELAIEAMRADTDERELLTRRHGELREALNAARAGARAARDRAEGLAARRQSAAAQLSAIREGAARSEERLAQLAARGEELALAAEAAGEPLLQLESELEAALDLRVTVEAELGRARAAMEAKTEQLRRLEQQQLVSEQSLQRLRTELEAARLEAKGLSTQAEAQTEALTAEGYEPAVLIDSLTPADQPAELAASAQDLARRIERLGAINLAAIDEYNVEAERKRYLDEQYQDLTEALTTLEAAIQKIDRETRARFKETFDAINSGLQALFPRVFGGGEAYLELTGDDLLDTGIAIMARPPGKRNSTIHLLSGGEKALTAIALVFAIFQLNPAPFCMLDEVDAPLDDANVGRYARMVEQMSANVQFIYITHNKIAMEMAHQLMGVTMHEPGVSRIVTVDVEEAAELAAV